MDQEQIEQQLQAREDAVFAKVGRLTYIVDEQARVLTTSQNTIQKLEAFLEEKNLRDEFVKWVENGSSKDETDAPKKKQ